MSAFPEATTASFSDLALDPGGLVLVDFFTPDCQPCRKLEPMLGALVRSTGERLRVVRVDAASSSPLAERYRVRGVPTLVLLRDGAELDRRTGFQTAGQLRAWIAPHLT